MFCENCRAIFPRKNWPPKRPGMVAFIGQARLGEQGHLPDRRPVFFPQHDYDTTKHQGMKLSDGLEEANQC